MGLTADEAIELSDEAAELGVAIGEAFAKDGPQGRRITKAEARKIVKKLINLAWQIMRDIAD